MKFTGFFILFIALTWALPATARQYRCNGRVQYRPCDQSLADVIGYEAPQLRIETLSKEGLKAQARWTKETFAPPRNARIVEQSFKPVGRSEGVWRGEVWGDGRVHLALKIFRGGMLESSRYMGAVNLDSKKTWFNFRSTRPRGNNWSWTVVAWTGKNNSQGEVAVN